MLLDAAADTVSKNFGGTDVLNSKTYFSALKQVYVRYVSVCFRGGFSKWSSWPVLVLSHCLLGER